MAPEQCAKFDSTITKLYDLLPYVAQDAARLRDPSELVYKSPELHEAARLIEETLPHPSLASGVTVLRVCIGHTAVEALSMSRNPYDFLESSYEVVEPGQEFDLRYKKRVSTDIFNPRHVQPVFGGLRYFDLATLGRTLEDGGELIVSQ